MVINFVLFKKYSSWNLWNFKNNLKISLSWDYKWFFLGGIVILNKNNLGCFYKIFIYRVNFKGFK